MAGLAHPSCRLCLWPAFRGATQATASPALQTHLHRARTPRQAGAHPFANPFLPVRLRSLMVKSRSAKMPLGLEDMSWSKACGLRLQRGQAERSR